MNLIRPDEEEEQMILTETEKEQAINNAIETAKKNKAWKLWNKGAKNQTIEAKISAIDWENEIDLDNVIKVANSNKHRLVWHEEQRRKEKIAELKKREELKKMWTARQFYNLMAWASGNVYGKKLIVNDDNLLLIKSLCFSLSEDPRFETELGFSLKKGLLIRGVSGVGKTHLVKCVSQNELKPIEVYSMIDISEIIKEDGEFNVGPGLIYLDDVGSEEPLVNHYGTRINWFKDFIEKYHVHDNPFNKLLISTNCSFDQLQEKYGFRVRSRMKEMFNVIDVTGKDMRK